MAYQWSMEFLEKTRISDTIDLDECTLMVYLPARTITSSLQDAIRKHLCCEEKDVDLLMSHVDQGKGVAILADGIDEIRDPKVIKHLQEYVRTRKDRGGQQVLVAARSDLSQIPSRSFDRFLVLRGFSLEQGEQYIRKYFSMEQSHKVTIQKVLDYIQKHKSKLEGVLCNPLQLYMFCALTSTGVLELRDDNIYNVVNLFEPLENFLVKRESEKKDGHPVTENDAQLFYCMCLHALITDVRRFSQSHLDKFKISPNYLVFLDKWDELGSNAEYTTYFEFKHETVFEYFGSKFIQKLPLPFLKSLLLSVCKKTLRNIQRMMMEIVAKRDCDKMTLYKAIIRAIIILQGNAHSGSVDSTSTAVHEKGTLQSDFERLLSFADDPSPSTIKTQLSELKHRIKDTSIEEMLLSYQNADQVSEANATWEEINSAFDSEAEALRAMGWFGDLEEKGIIQHIMDCLEVCTPQQQEEILRSSLLCLLPCKYIHER